MMGAWLVSEGVGGDGVGDVEGGEFWEWGVRRTSLVNLMRVKMGEGVVLGEGERGVEGDARVEWDVKRVPASSIYDLRCNNILHMNIFLSRTVSANCLTVSQRSHYSPLNLKACSWDGAFKDTSPTAFRRKDLS
jgi:hypothetical protein